MTLRRNAGREAGVTLSRGTDNAVIIYAHLDGPLVRHSDK